MRTLRRLVVLLVFVCLVGFIWWLFFAPDPTCIDDMKNGAEEGVDCGLAACGFECPIVLSPPQVISTSLIPAT